MVTLRLDLVGRAPSCPLRHVSVFRHVVVAFSAAICWGWPSFKSSSVTTFDRLVVRAIAWSLLNQAKCDIYGDSSVESVLGCP